MAIAMYVQREGGSSYEGSAFNQPYLDNYYLHYCTLNLYACNVSDFAYIGACTSAYLNYINYIPGGMCCGQR